jgi:hypothetical protein
MKLSKAPPRPPPCYLYFLYISTGSTGKFVCLEMERSFIFNSLRNHIYIWVWYGICICSDVIIREDHSAVVDDWLS